MKRGEVWAAVGAGPYGSKPRPVIIMQSDLLDTTESVLVCPLTTDPTDAPLVRPEIAATPTNGLRAASRAMADKLAPALRSRIEQRIGVLSDEDMLRVERAAAFALGLGG